MSLVSYVVKKVKLVSSSEDDNITTLCVSQHVFLCVFLCVYNFMCYIHFELNLTELAMPKNTDPKPMAGECLKALVKLLSEFNNSPTQLASFCGIHIQTYYGWCERGQISKKAAIRLGEDERIPFTKEELRPDIKVWE